MLVYNSININKEDTIRLNEIADSIRDKYSMALDTYYDQYGKEPYWWLLSLTSRNENYDDTLLRISLLLLVLEKVNSGKYDRVVTDKRDIWKSLKTITMSAGLDVCVDLDEESSIRHSLVKLKDFATSIVYRSICGIKQIVTNNVGKTLAFTEPDSIDLLFFGPLLLNKIRGDEYQDGYFSRLNEVCNKSFYYCPEVIYNTDETRKGIIDKLNRINTYKFVYLYHYTKWYDFIYSLRFIMYCHKLKRNRYFFDGYDITPIIRASIDKDIHRIDFDYAVKYYLATRRLTRSIPIRKTIQWYEARPVDIAISLAIRDSGQIINRVGYIGYPLAECMHGQSPMRSQAANSVTPGIITVPGKRYADIIKRYTPTQKTVTVPAFRVKSTGIRERKSDLKYDIFMAMSYFPNVCRDMIRIVNNYCRTSHRDGLRILVKMHPIYAGCKIGELYNDKLFFEPEYTQKNIYECLNDSCVAFTASSSSSMDAILNGTYLICLSHTGQLYYTCIAPGIDPDRFSIVFDEDDFAKAMKRAEDFNKSLSMRSLSPDDYFIPANKENFEPLFE